MARAGLLVPTAVGTGKCSVDGEVTHRLSTRAEPTSLWLDWGTAGHGIEQRVVIDRTVCGYGGTRPWFSCPSCGRRAAVLYLRGSFRCRSCAQVAYLSQSEDVIARSWRRQRRADAKLGEDCTKPKGMHCATFDRLRATIEECEVCRDEAMMAWPARRPPK